jgi:hypothetical protein
MRIRALQFDADELEQTSKSQGCQGNTLKSGSWERETKTNNKNKVKVDVARSRVAAEYRDNLPVSFNLVSS